MIELGLPEWLPDQPVYANPGATEAKNVLPGLNYYKPLRGLSPVSDALDAYCRGASAAADADGNVSVFSGDGTKLYILVSGEWVDISVAGGYNVNDGQSWEFAKFGERMIATTFSEPVQFIDLGASGFADLITSTLKPRAAHIAVVRDYVVLGDTTDNTDGHVSERVWWSAINTPTDFDRSVTTLCGSQDLPNGGAVQRIVNMAPGYGLIFKQRSIYRMVFTGPPEIARFDEIEQARGALMPGGVQVWGNTVYFIAEDGFYRLREGEGAVPIGRERVDRYFLADLDLSNKHRVSSGICTKSGCVWWSYPGDNNVGGLPNKLIFYNWVTDRFSRAVVDTQLLFGTLSTGYTLEELDTISSDIDNFPAPFDSPEWQGGEYAIAAFDSDNKLAFFGGDFLTSVLETAEAQPFKPERSFVSQVWPLIEEAGTTTIQMGTRNKLKDSVTWSGTSVENSIGAHDFTSDARYHRVRITVAGGFDKARGAQIEAVASGLV